MRKLLALLALLVPFSGLMAQATYTTTINHVIYQMRAGSSSCSVIGNNGASGDVVIPATVEYEGNTWQVGSIEAEAFQNGQLTSIATAEGLADSETVTATLCWLEASPEAWGEHITVGIEEGRQKPLIIQRHANALTIEGTEPGTVVSAYDLNGRMLGTANTQEGTTVVPLQAAPGTQPVILHIGQKSVKVL